MEWAFSISSSSSRNVARWKYHPLNALVQHMKEANNMEAFELQDIDH